MNLFSFEVKEIHNEAIFINNNLNFAKNFSVVIFTVNIDIWR